MRLVHRHQWRWDAEHRHGTVMWTVEACRCGKRRKGYWSYQPIFEPQATPLLFSPKPVIGVMFTAPVAWHPA